MTSSACKVQHLSIDIETYSPADLPSVGVYGYSEDPGFRVLLLGYAWDDGPVEVIDLVHDEMPDDIIEALDDPDVIKHAFNANFERVCLSRLLFMDMEMFLDPAQWSCTMVQAAYWGIPGSLKQVSAYLGLEERKDASGTRLISRFSKPGRDGKEPVWEGEDWERFVAYNVQDVVVERAIQRALPGPIPDGEQKLYAVDAHINDLGAHVDTTLAKQARLMAEDEAVRSQERLAALTGLDNPNSTIQLRGWLNAHLGDHGPLESIGREVLQGLLDAGGLDPVVGEVVRLRLDSAKSSVKKYVVAQDAACSDGRLRGCFQFYGAATGRWAGRLMQLQNLPRGDLHGEDLDVARELVRAGDTDGVEMIYGNVPDVLKSLVRTVLVPRDGDIFAVSDFSAIEARVVAWLAGEEAVLQTFRTTGRIYEATASRMFGVPEEQVDHDLRQRGKVATLALGYGGGPTALIHMGALALGIPEKELPRMVRMWRNANKHIVALWGEVEGAVREVLSGEGRNNVGVACDRCRVYRCQEVTGFAIELPSGRSLYYRDAKEDPFSGDLAYSSSGRGAGITRIKTWGGRLVENITQAVARDLLGVAMERMGRQNLRIVAHVHDEVIVEVPLAWRGDAVDELNRLMSRGADWSEGLPLSADGYTCTTYRKE